MTSCCSRISPATIGPTCTSLRVTAAFPLHQKKARSMKKKGFRELVSESLKEKIKFQGETKRPRSFLRVEIMMLQLVQRAASGDSKALRRIVKILKKHQPAPPPVRMHFYSSAGNWNVVD